MGEYFPSPEEAVAVFCRVLETGAVAQKRELYPLPVSTKDLIEETFRFFHSIQKGALPEERYESVTANQREYRRKKDELLKEQGICVICGKRQAIPGLTRCEVCRQKAREYRKQHGERTAGASKSGLQPKTRRRRACMNS